MIRECELGWIVMIPRLVAPCLIMQWKLHWLEGYMWQWVRILVMLTRIGIVLHTDMVGNMVRKGNRRSD